MNKIIIELYSDYYNIEVEVVIPTVSCYDISTFINILNERFDQKHLSHNILFVFEYKNHKIILKASSRVKTAYTLKFTKKLAGMLGYSREKMNVSENNEVMINLSVPKHQSSE